MLPLPPDSRNGGQASAQRQATWLKSCCPPLAQLNLHTKRRGGKRGQLKS